LLYFPNFRDHQLLVIICNTAADNPADHVISGPQIEGLL